jgi:O-antigen ligase
MREDPDTSNAIWIPLIWMFLAGSRYLSQWLDLGGGVSSFQVYQEGSPVDAAVFAALILAGAAILLRRKLDWRAILARNKWIWLYFLFCTISIVWSDDSIVSLKRWVKALGDVIMVLVILTEDHPYKAACTALRRLALVTLPLSVLFIKFVPELGRMYHMGSPLYTGVAAHKSGLGQTCLIAGIFFLWSLIFRWHEEIEKGGLPRALVNVLFLFVIVWLLYMADSATAVTSILIVVVLFAAARVPAVASKPRRFVVLGGIVISLFAFLELTVGMSDWIITSLGRSRDLTTRVPMWEMLLSMDTNPLLGVGYESFWSGERMSQIWRKYPGIIQAHNGYVELYLNVGAIGLLLLLIGILSGFVKAIKQLEDDYSISVLRVAFIATAVLNNWTEATIRPVSNMFIILLFGIMDVVDRDGLGEDRDDLRDRD